MRTLASRIAAMASRYGLVGLFCAALNVAIVWVGTEILGWSYGPAAALTCPITIPLSYWLHRRISFDVQEPSSVAEFLRFVLAQLSQFALGFALMALVVEVLHWPAWIAMAGVSVLMMAYGFLTSSAWVFRVWRMAPPGAAPADAPSPRTLRVLQVSAFFPAHGGGIEVVAGQLARHLALSGVAVTWMAGGAAAERPAPEPGVPIAIDRASSFDVLERRLGLPAPVWSPASLRRLWRHVGACDVVQVHDYLYVPSLAALLFARLRRRPVVLTQHVGEIPYTSAFARGLLQAINRVVGRLALGAAAQVVFVGRPVQAYFERFVRFRRAPLLISNGVDQAVYRPASTSSPSVGAELRALFVGRFVEKKGLRLLQECMSVPGIRWEFVGRGPLSPEHWNVPPGVLVLRGVLEPQAVADAMRGADLLVLPSHGEGFPLVVQESLACGTPVLVSQEVADAFPIRDPACVHAVDVGGDHASSRLRGALARLAADPGAIRAARPQAVALAGQWSWERCVRAYRAVYDELEHPDAHRAERRVPS
jgi:glycosyltransferase involved in cell wall biosynthesis/putative flippase GtrA